jgi:hypothetical protein
MISSYPYPPDFMDWMREVFANPVPFFEQVLFSVGEVNTSNVTYTAVYSPREKEWLYRI